MRAEHENAVNRRQVMTMAGSAAGLGLLAGCTQLLSGTARFSAKPAASWWHAHCPESFAVVNILRGGTELVVRESASVLGINRAIELTSWVLTQLLYVDGRLQGELVMATTPRARLGGAERNPATEVRPGDVLSNVGTGPDETGEGSPIPASSVATETFDGAPSIGRLVEAGYQGFVTELAVTEPLRETGRTKVEGRADVTLAPSVDRKPGQTAASEDGIQAHVIGQRIDHAEDVVVLAGWMNESDADLLESFIGDVTFVDAGAAETDRPGSIVHPGECPEACTTFVERLMAESRRAFEALREEMDRDSSQGTG